VAGKRQGSCAILKRSRWKRYSSKRRMPCRRGMAWKLC